MVLIAPLVGAAVFLSGLTSALPTSSSNYGSSDSSSSNYGSSDSSSSNYGSSSSNYGSSGSSSNYGGSSSNYGGSSSNYGNSGSNYGDNQDTSSSSMMTTSTTQGYNNQYTTTTSAYNNQYTSSTQDVQYTSTTTASNSYQTSNYGSGSSYWGGSGYEDCVNQCIAQFGGSTGGGSYQATATSGYGGSAGTDGVTHTIIVAPTQGVLRMVPFATNASVGDTIEFHWGANNHTVTKSSALTPCNKSSDAPVFATGEQNMNFVFSEVVNDTNPIFYYCGTPTHCEKGMFGVINPAQAAPGSPSSLGGMMASMAANNSDLSAYSAYANNLTASNNAANTWGENFDMSSIPEWAQSLYATNVLYTRAMMAKNPEIITANNAIDLSSVASTPLALPMDISSALNDATAATASSAATVSSAPAPAADAATAAASSASSASASPSAPAKNGASSVASPRMLVGAMVILATIFAL